MRNFLLTDEIFVYPHGEIFKVRKHNTHFYGVSLPVTTRFADEHGDLWEVVYERPEKWGSPVVVAVRIQT